MVHEQGDNHECRALPGSAEHCSRRALQAFLQIQQRWGGGGPVCVQADYPAAEISWRPDPEAEALDALDTTPGEDTCQPPMEPGWESPEQSLPAKDHVSPGCPSMEEL